MEQKKTIIRIRKNNQKKLINYMQKEKIFINWLIIKSIVIILSKEILLKKL